MRVRLLFLLTCALIFFPTYPTAFAQADRSDRVHHIDLHITLNDLGSLEMVSEAMRIDPVHTLIGEMLESVLVDRTTIAKDVIKDILGSEFKSIDVAFAKKVGRGRSTNKSPRTPDNEGEFAIMISIGQISTGSSSASTPNARVTLHLEMRPAILSEDAAKIENQIRDRLAKELPEYSRQFMKTRLETANVEIERALKGAEKERDSLVAKQEKLSEGQGLPADKAAEQLVEIERQLLSSRLSAAGLEARERAIEEHIKRLEQQEPSEADKIQLANLAKIYDLRSETLKRLKTIQNAAGSVSTEQVNKAEADMLGAKMEYEKAQATARGAERLTTLTVELTKVAIDKAEATARREYLEKARKETAEKIRKGQELARISSQLNRTKALIIQYSDRLESLKSAPEKIEPVEIIANQARPVRGNGEVGK